MLIPKDEIIKTKEKAKYIKQEWIEDFYYNKRKQKREIQDLVNYYTKIKNMEGVLW